MGSCGNFLQKTCKFLPSCLSLAGVRKSTLATTNFLIAVANCQNKTWKFAKRPPRVRKSLAVFLFVGKRHLHVATVKQIAKCDKVFQLQAFVFNALGQQGTKRALLFERKFRRGNQQTTCQTSNNGKLQTFCSQSPKDNKVQKCHPVCGNWANGIDLCGAMASKTKLFGICRGWKKYNEA